MVLVSSKFVKENFARCAILDWPLLYLRTLKIILHFLVASFVTNKKAVHNLIAILLRGIYLCPLDTSRVILFFSVLWVRYNISTYGFLFTDSVWDSCGFLIHVPWYWVSMDFFEFTLIWMWRSIFAIILEYRYLFKYCFSSNLTLF